MELIKRNANGSTEGADPRTLTHAELNAAGHFKKSPLDVIRAKCLDCCVDQPGEVRKCTAIKCPSWPYRFAINPFGVRRGAGKPFSQKNSRQNGEEFSGAGDEVDVVAHPLKRAANAENPSQPAHLCVSPLLTPADSISRQIGMELRKEARATEALTCRSSEKKSAKLA